MDLGENRVGVDTLNNLH